MGKNYENLSSKQKKAVDWRLSISLKETKKILALMHHGDDSLISVHTRILPKTVESIRESLSAPDKIEETIAMYEKREKSGLSK